MEQIQIGSKLKVGYGTHEGMSGKHNEDFLGVFAWKISDSETFYLGVVADGVGGQTAGEVASHLTVTTIQEYFDKLPQLDDVSKHLEQSILAANEVVYKASQENSEYRGMSTTVAMAAIFDNGLYTAYVGDSRLYLMRDGRLIQISVDHTWAQEAIEAGLLTREEAKTHPNRNVIRRHLGGGLNVQVDHRLVLQPGQSPSGTEANQGTPLHPSDTILICSDGLTDMIGDDLVHESLHSHFYDLPTASSELIDKANRAGGRDNITVVILQIPGKAPAAIIAPIPEVTAAAAAAPAGASITSTAAPIAAAAGPVVAQPGPEISSNRTMWLVIGGIALLFLLGAAAALVFLVSSSLGNDPTPEATTTSSDEADATLPVGAPATAAILLTGAASGGQDGSDPLSTPELIPTLRSTVTPTPIPGVVPTEAGTSTPASSPTATSSSGSGSSNGGSSPKPTSTSVPPTAIPPTNVSTATAPSATEPPATEPPATEPPATEPPATEPPATEPPSTD